MESFLYKIISLFEKYLYKIPFVRKKIEEKMESVNQTMDGLSNPYKGKYPSYTSLPHSGESYDKIKSLMEELANKEKSKWQDGFASGTVYHGKKDHIDFLNEIYALNSQANPLHSDIFPSATKYEAEIIAMTAKMLGSHKTQDTICGSVSSGGSESIMLAMKTYRDFALVTRGIKNPEMLVPVTAHAAFNKAAQFFKIKLRAVPFDSSFRVDMKSLRKMISRNTIVLVGSAPTFPHGVIDPIKELSELARSKKIPLHVDACLGGFVLPWAKKLGYKVPEFDFSLEGVTSISVDTHKYGFAAKGTSVILYRSEALRRYQYFTMTEWPGGLYFSPTFAGSRPGALSAVCWATLVTVGEEGYLTACKKILEAGEKLKEGLRKIPELKILGDPLWNISFASDQINIYQVMDFMSQRSWVLNGLHKPSCVHLCLTLRHTEPQVLENFLSDLSEAVLEVKKNPQKEGGMAPIYGMAASLPFRGTVSSILKKYMDTLYKV